MFAALATAVIFATASFAQKNSDPEGYLTYSLPRTVLVLEVEAVQENFYAGPYAAYAEKYLGITVPQEDNQSFYLKSVKMTPYVEPDHSKRYSVNVPNGNMDISFLKLMPLAVRWVLRRTRLVCRAVCLIWARVWRFILCVCRQTAENIRY